MSILKQYMKPGLYRSAHFIECWK